MTQVAANTPPITPAPLPGDVEVNEDLSEAGAPESGTASPIESRSEQSTYAPANRFAAPDGGLNRAVQQYAVPASPTDAAAAAGNAAPVATTPRAAEPPRKGAPQEQPAAARARATPAQATAAAAGASFAATVDRVDQLGQRLASGQQPASDEDRAAWQGAQAELRDASAAYADAVRQLPPDAPERAAAQRAFADVGERIAAIELPVLARLDPALGKDWALFNNKAPNSEGAVLDQRLKTYGLTRDDLKQYVLTGVQPPGLKRALDDAQRRGEWPALGVVRAAFMLRADYLRATAAPGDVASAKMADSLGATASTLSAHRAAIHLAWGTRAAARVLNDKPDPAQRSVHEQKQLDEARRAIESVRAHAVEQVMKHPDRYGKDSATRTLAADGLATEASLAQTEATGQMRREAQALAQDTAARDPKRVPPPPALPADLAAGGLVDQKRNEARTIDPRLNDVVAGGDRAVRFTRESLELKSLRLANGEQQVAHLTSRQQAAAAAHQPAPPPPAGLVADLNRQREALFRDTLETQQRLTQQKAGSLSLAQTRLVGQLDGDVAHLARGIAAVTNDKAMAEVENTRLQEQTQTATTMRQKVDDELTNLDKNKLERLRSELGDNHFLAAPRSVLLQQDPAGYARAQPDSKQEQQRRAVLTLARDAVDAKLAQLGTDGAAAAPRLERARAVDALDGDNTAAAAAVALAQQALARSAPHLGANPPKGAERVERLQAALDHQSAVTEVAALRRDTADARLGIAGQQAMAIEAKYQRETPGADDPLGKSRAAITQALNETAAQKRGALSDAKAAVTQGDVLRQRIGTELAGSKAKPGELQAYKDALAAQGARAHGTVADLASDLDPAEATAQLDLAAKIVTDELPVQQVSRLDAAQAKADHAHNAVRAETLAALGETAIAVAQRADVSPGVPYGLLAVEALGHAARGAMRLDETLLVDAGGAAGDTVDKARIAELKARGSAIRSAVQEIDRNVDAGAVAAAIDDKLLVDAEQYNSDYAAMVKEIESRDFGWTINLTSEVLAGYGVYERSANDEAREVGMQWLNLGAGKGAHDAKNLHQLADDIRAMRAAGVSSHVIMAALRDPRLGANATGEQRAQWMRELQGVAQGRFGAVVPVDLPDTATRVRTGTPLGRALDAAPSNDTRALLDFVGSRSTDLLGDAQAKMREGYAASAKDWQRFSPYVKLGQVLDQVILTTASSVAFAGVFARVAAVTTLPAKFEAARKVAMTLSLPGRIGALAGINAAEAGLGMLTGSVVSRVGNGIFGEGTLGAKIFNTIGSGMQLNVGSAVAMRTGIGFQVTLGVTMGAAPIVAEELGMSPALAEKLGTAVGIFLPTAIGTIGQLRSAARVPDVMVHEYGVDAAQARALAGEGFRTLGNDAPGGAGGVRERAGRLVDARLKDLPAEARGKLADTLTLDVARARVPLDPPAHGEPATYVHEIEGYYTRLEGELVKQGVAPDRARELVLAEKTAMYHEALATTNGFLAGSEAQPGRPDARSAGGAAASTRQAAGQLARDVLQPASRQGGADPAARTASLARDEIAQLGGIARDAINAQGLWPSMRTPEEKVAFLKHAVNARLQALGLPEVGLIGLDARHGADGLFNLRQHEVALRESLLQKAVLNDADVAALTEVLRHELEHGLQATDVARLLAAQGANAGHIVFTMGKGTSLQVAERVAHWAVAEQAAGRGIDPASPRGQAAKLILGSLYEGRPNASGFTRMQVLENLSLAQDEVLRTRAALAHARGTPLEAAAMQEVRVAEHYYGEAHRQYRELPEEQGAFLAGDLAKKEAEIALDRTTPGADDFENAATGVFERPRATSPSTQAPEAPRSRAEPAAPATARPDEVTGRYTVPVDGGSHPAARGDLGNTGASRQLSDWEKKGKLTGDVAGLRNRLASGDEVVRRAAEEELDDAKAAIEAGGRFHVEQDPHARSVSRSAEPISDVDKINLRDSAWLRNRLGSEERVRDFGEWLKKNHKSAELGAEVAKDGHDHLPLIGSAADEAAVTAWAMETGVRLPPVR